MSDGRTVRVNLGKAYTGQEIVYALEEATGEIGNTQLKKRLKNGGNLRTPDGRRMGVDSYIILVHKNNEPYLMLRADRHEKIEFDKTYRDLRICPVSPSLTGGESVEFDVDYANALGRALKAALLRIPEPEHAFSQ